MILRIKLSLSKTEGGVVLHSVCANVVFLFIIVHCILQIHCQIHAHTCAKVHHCNVVQR